MTTVIEIISAHLRTIGADGLVQPDAECGCELSDLAPCCGEISQCRPGYRGASTAPDEGDWSMYTTREAAAASLGADADARGGV